MLLEALLALVLLVVAAASYAYYLHARAKVPLAHLPGINQFWIPYIKIPFVKMQLDATNKQGFIDTYRMNMANNKHGLAKQVVFNRSYVCVFNHEFVKHVMITKAKNYPKPFSKKIYQAFDIWGPNILTTNYDEWRKHRAISNSAFSEKHIELLSTITNDTMLDVLNTVWKNDSFELDVVHAMTSITLQIMGLAGFGTDLQAIKENVTYDQTRYTMPLKEAITLAASNAVIARFQFGNWICDNAPFEKFRRLREAIRNTDKYLNDFISARSNDTEQRYDLLSLLIAAKSEETGTTGLTPTEIKSDSFIFLFAGSFVLSYLQFLGHETTASQLMWTLWLLATHPEIQDKLLQEVNEVFGDRERLEHDDHEKLKYTLCVIRESMRLNPPIASVLKEAVEDDVIGGFKIPAGTTITAQFYTIHRDPTLWEKPEEFIPERFDEHNAHKIHPTAYMPFSLGSRKCIGFLFSLTESVFILAHIIRNFSVSRTEEQKRNGFVPVPQQVITIQPKELTLQFTRRAKQRL